MNSTDNDTSAAAPNGAGRRDVLMGTLAAGAGLVASRRTRAQTKTKLKLAVWGDQTSQMAHRNVIARYEQQNPSVEIALEVTPGGEFYQQIDTRLAGRQAPDMFRIQYQQVGRYAAGRTIVDLTPYLPADYGRAFVPEIWQAVMSNGRPVAMPYHTDTIALIYNTAVFEKLGITAPTSIDKSWNWSEFVDVGRRIKNEAELPYGMTMIWQDSNAYRWLPFLYQHGGRVFDDDFKTPQIGSKIGIETIAWTQSWFTEGLAPPSTAIKTHEQPQNLFANGTMGMYLGGDWHIWFLRDNATVPWSVTYMPRDVGMASDMGGNCIAISRDCKTPELAADFLKFLASEESMRDFARDAALLPVRTALTKETLDYGYRPDAMKVFAEQARTVPTDLAKTVGLPIWAQINQRMADELDLAFTSGQPAAETGKNIDDAIRSITSS
jgi:multiple sugar transport system substrate-binding protein